MPVAGQVRQIISRGWREPEALDDGNEDRSLAYQRPVRERIEAQRGALIRLRNEGAINNEVMRRIERELDLEESRLEL
jgi:monovalent cation/hydrogen antiporter